MFTLFRPCRLSFVACALWALFMEPERAHDLTVIAEPPKWAIALSQQQE